MGWNIFTGNNEDTAASFKWLSNNGWLGFNDIFLPGSSALNKFFDFNGQQAAQQQYVNQLA